MTILGRQHICTRESWRACLAKAERQTMNRMTRLGVLILVTACFGLPMATAVTYDGTNSGVTGPNTTCFGAQQDHWVVLPGSVRAFVVKNNAALGRTAGFADFQDGNLATCPEAGGHI